MEIYNDMYLVDTNTAVLESAIEDKPLQGKLMVDFHTGTASFDCPAYFMAFECSGIDTEETGDSTVIILHDDHESHVFTSKKPYDFQT